MRYIFGIITGMTGQAVISQGNTIDYHYNGKADIGIIGLSLK